ncbi:hypothetical protein [Streptomyces tendae]
MKLSRRISSILAILVSLAGANLFASQSAQAATSAISCSGTVTARYTSSLSGYGVIGEMIVYYNSSNGGTNSACVYRRGAAEGVASTTYVFIDKCSQTSGEGRTCSPIAQDSDSGSFAYYAGPAGVTGTANNCVSVHGGVGFKGGVFGFSGEGKTVGC